MCGISWFLNVTRVDEMEPFVGEIRKKIRATEQNVHYIFDKSIFNGKPISIN
jgi:hypothetical protein